MEQLPINVCFEDDSLMTPYYFPSDPIWSNFQFYFDSSKPSLGQKKEISGFATSVLLAL